MSECNTINLLPDMPVLGSSNKDMMAKIWTNGDTTTCFSRKHKGKRRNCSSKAVCCLCVKISIYGVKG